MKLIKEGNANAIETAIVFLEADPVFFRSGYLKEELIENLKKVEFTEKQKTGIQNILLRIIDTKYCREFRRYCKLSRKVNTKDFLIELEKRAESANKDISRRAKWMLKFAKKIKRVN